MADKEDIHTVPHGDGWANRREGAERVSKTFETKAEAEAAGREQARRAEVDHISHRRDGTMGEQRSYGNDPNPPKDNA